MARRKNVKAPEGQQEVGFKAYTEPAETPNQAGGLTADQDFKKIYQIYAELKSNGEKYKPLWDRISQLVAISVQPDYQWTNAGNKAQQLDQFVDDPTAALSVNQAGDYLAGIMWNTGENILTIKPSRYVKALVDEAVVKDYYNFVTEQLLYHMNHPDAGYVAALQPYCYDQFGFGNGAIGLFKNSAFLMGVDQNCLVARNYGIDNTRIKLGKSGGADYGSVIYHWTCERIISEFCTINGTVDNKRLSQMPEPIQKAYEARDFTTEFDLVFMWLPREDFDPKLMGRRGYKWRGVWFMDNGNSSDRIFCEESFRERPINWCGMIRVRGEDYGRSSGTLMLSSISSVNYMFAITQEILEQMAQPPLGIFGNAIFGDGVLDTSADGLTVFNAQFAQNDTPPVFPLHQALGDPKGIIEFLIPYLNKNITTAFKVDVLLDFNTDTQMTATESLQRYNIRGKSLSGILTRQKNERLIPDVRRAMSICWECGELGVNKDKRPDLAKRYMQNKQTQRIIPDEVLEVFAAGKPWYEIEFNNELEKLLRSAKIQELVQLLQGITAIAALYPDIIHAIDWYQLLADLNDNLDINSRIVVSANEFKATIEKIAKERQMAMQAQMAQLGAAAGKDAASAQNQMAQAGALRNGQTKPALPAG